MQEEDVLAVFNKQLVEDRRIVVSRSNLNEILKVHISRLILLYSSGVNL